MSSSTEVTTRPEDRAEPGAIPAMVGRSRNRLGPAGGLGLLLVALALLVLAVGLSLAVGSNPIPLSAVWNSVWTELFGTGETYADDVVASRIPQTVLGLIAGSALAVAGVVMQALTRNPLADPGILGVNAGAAAGIVTAMAFFGLSGATTNVWAALPGAFLAVVIVYALASGRRGSTPVRLVLTGTVVSSVLMAYIQAVTLNLDQVFGAYRFWAVGGLAGRTMEQAISVLPFFVVGMLLALPLGASLNALALGEESATSLGVRTGRAKIIGALSATLLCASATAAVGPIGFVGLAVPHIVRSFTGPDNRWLILVSAVAGPALLLFSDVLGRWIARPEVLMTGIVTAVLGAPLLIVAVRRMRGLT